MNFDIKQALTRGPVFFTVILICLLWTIPTGGVLISSFRTERAINTSGWWEVFAPTRINPEFRDLQNELDRSMLPLNRANEQLEEAQAALADAETALATANDANDEEAAATAQTAIDEANEDIASIQTRITERLEPNIVEAQAAIDNAEIPRNISLFSDAWFDQWTLSNYDAVLNSENMGTAFVNSLLVTIPSVVIPITIAAFAAYAFAWMNFPGRNLFFAIVVILMVVPLHVALVPLLRLYSANDLSGTYLGIWLAHTGFGMPLAIYLLYGYISTIPKEIMESAQVDGASPFTTFTRLVLPLSVPAIASFAIFQFLWVWNDLLVALVFLGTQVENRVVTRELQELVGSKGQDWELLTAGAFITMTVPLIIFFALQRYFVRGMMAGSVKG